MHPPSNKPVDACDPWWRGKIHLGGRVENCQRCGAALCTLCVAKTGDGWVWCSECEDEDRRLTEQSRY